MELWFLVICTISIAALLKAISDHFFPNPTNNTPPKTTTKLNLPPGPISFPILTTLQILHKFSTYQLVPWLRTLQAKFGPIIALHIGSQLHIFVFSRDLAHWALVQSGAVFASRPNPTPVSDILHEKQHNISTALYGPTWRLLRRNLVANVMHPSHVASFSHARESSMRALLSRVEASKGGPVNIAQEFQHSMFRLLGTMCFGDHVDEKKMDEIEEEERSFLLALDRFQILDLWPGLTKIILPNRWAEIIERKRRQFEVFIRIIRARRAQKPHVFSSYLDSLLELELQEEKNGEDEPRKVTDSEIVALCSEFLNAGTDTSTSSFEWIMANLVKYPEIQTKLVQEIQAVIGVKAKQVKEEDLDNIPYLRAVVLEGLRRHPPGHLLVPHGVVRNTELGGYLIPKNATVHFMAADMGWDPQVWDRPHEFRPERFLKGEEGEGFDIKGGGGEIKMMPFGVGRRMCPGYNLGMLHLMYFVGNLVWKFEVKPVDGAEIDMSEKLKFTTVMKYPLVAQISPRGEHN